jgi:hypothetical protein
MGQVSGTRVPHQLQELEDHPLAADHVIYAGHDA